MEIRAPLHVVVVSSVDTASSLFGVGSDLLVWFGLGLIEALRR